MDSQNNAGNSNLDASFAKRSFCYVDGSGQPLPLIHIDLFHFEKTDIEAADRALEEASMKLKSIIVCQQVKEQIRSGIKTLWKTKTKRLGHTKKASLRLYSTHGLENFTASVPFRYNDPSSYEDLLDREISNVFHVCPFNVCINICTWISPTTLRKLAASGNLVHFIQWCLSSEVTLQSFDIPADAKDKAFSHFAETPVWAAFYEDWRTYERVKESPSRGGCPSPTGTALESLMSSPTEPSRKELLATHHISRSIHKAGLHAASRSRKRRSRATADKNGSPSRSQISSEQSQSSEQDQQNQTPDKKSISPPQDPLQPNGHLSNGQTPEQQQPPLHAPPPNAQDQAPGQSPIASASLYGSYAPDLTFTARGSPRSDGTHKSVSPPMISAAPAMSTVPIAYTQPPMWPMTMAPQQTFTLADQFAPGFPFPYMSEDSLHNPPIQPPMLTANPQFLENSVTLVQRPENNAAWLGLGGAAEFMPALHEP